MALESWPEALNSLAQRGTFSHKPGDANIRTDMDGGPSRVRRRFTNVPQQYQFQVLMTSLEKLVFEGFFANIVNAGADWFSMPVVVGNEYLTSTVRIVKDGVSFSDAGYDKYILSLGIEIRDLPTLDALTAWLIGNYGYPDPFSDPLQIVVNQLYPSAWGGLLEDPQDVNDPNVIYLVDEQGNYLVDSDYNYLVLGN